LDNDQLTGTSYYRLKLITDDGRISLSHIVAVSRNLLKDISLSPNPVTKSAVFAHPALSDKTLVCLFDATGNILQKIVIEPCTNNTTIDASRLSAGTYFLQYTDSRQTQVLKFVKQ
jgi:hypothetical protein